MEVYEKEAHIAIDQTGIGTFKLVSTFNDKATPFNPIRLLYRSGSHYDLLE